MASWERRVPRAPDEFSSRSYLQEAAALSRGRQGRRVSRHARALGGTIGYLRRFPKEAANGREPLGFPTAHHPISWRIMAWNSSILIFMPRCCPAPKMVRCWIRDAKNDPPAMMANMPA